MATLIYALACVVLPAAWGVAMSHAFAFVQRRRRDDRAGEGPPPIDYSI